MNVQQHVRLLMQSYHRLLGRPLSTALMSQALTRALMDGLDEDDEVMMRRTIG